MAAKAPNGTAAPNGTTATNGSAAANGDVATKFAVRIASGAALVAFSAGNRQNPFSREKMRELTDLVKELDADPSIGCIVLSGGEGRSFSAGGDFHETSSFTGGDEVDAWLDDVTNLYTTIAGASTPFVAAIDGYAIGLGLQMALCCDYRIGSETSQFVMPELRMGIACNFGGFMLEAVVGRVVMQKMLFTSDKWSAQAALKDGLVHELVPSQDLVSRALERARTIGSWATEAVQGTRPKINTAFVQGLKALGAQAKESHRTAFAAGSAQNNMNKIITKSRQKAPSWILVTNAPVAALERTLQTVKDSGIHVYGQGAALSATRYSWRDDTAEPLHFSEWATSVDVKPGLVRMRTGALNDPPLYVVRNTTTRNWAIGTDAFTLNIARSQWGMPTGFAEPNIISRDETTSFFGVSQLPAHSSFDLKQDGRGWTLATSQHPDPVLAAVFNPRITDFTEAGSVFLSALQKAVTDVTSGSDSVATLLSGGIDSGAVTTFAVLAGRNVTAYSAGSPWGNEHDEAAELAAFLGIPHVRIDFSADELLAAVPESMRALASAEHERVDIAVTITALLRSGAIKEPHVLTGYGSDLLNLGLPPASAATDALLQEIVDGVDVTRHSGEFTDTVARAWGKKMSHPYWHPDVVRAALSIHPACKIRGGREKAFFRAAMEPYVPHSTAWRKKIGIHLGGGLQGGLDALFGGREGKVEAYTNTFKAITTRLLADPFAAIGDLAPKPPAAPTNGAKHAAASLTPSGAGSVVDGANAASDLDGLVQSVLRESQRARFVLVRNLALGEEAFKHLVRAIGEPVVHKFQEGGSDLMKLPATREKGNVVLGRGPLPVHTDGMFVGHRPDLIMLYAAEFADEPGSGETTVIDQRAAVDEMPAALRARLESSVFEYRIQETGHHNKDLGDRWFAVASLQTEADGRQVLSVAMHFPPGIERSWDIRVAGVAEAESDALLDELDGFLNQPRYRYQHPWRVGDLLVIDNYGTLHGRTAIGEGGVRVLFRGQVNRRA